MAALAACACASATEDGQITNVMNELDEMKKEESYERLSFNEKMIKVTTRLIQKKKSFCDFMLSLSWRMIEVDGTVKPEESELFATIMATSEDIVNQKDKRDWHWMKKVMLDSHVESFVVFVRIA